MESIQDFYNLELQVYLHEVAYGQKSPFPQELFEIMSLEDLQWIEAQLMELVLWNGLENPKATAAMNAVRLRLEIKRKYLQISKIPTLEESQKELVERFEMKTDDDSICIGLLLALYKFQKTLRGKLLEFLIT